MRICCLHVALLLAAVAISSAAGNNNATSNSIAPSSTSGLASSASSSTTNSQPTSSASPGSSNSTHTSSPTETSNDTNVNPLSPPGYLTLLQPLGNADFPPIYAIGSTVHLKWNFSDTLQVIPPSLEIGAVGPQNNYYTWLTNLTGNTTEAWWNSQDYGQGPNEAPLMEGHYTVHIFDSSRGRNAKPVAGLLYQFNSLKVGLYNKQPYQRLDGTSGKFMLSRLQRIVRKLIASLAQDVSCPSCYSSGSRTSLSIAFVIILSTILSILV
ncbi:hypothetical protein BZG36_02645 [Bifiguratus adelaidae]|uniref:DUF7137 domain-containing protein n=1 Tax=Bifiguratus adelaidae TaxID=1938954 RepID=A0A261Y2W8_9FUNG|nr:hypothetical protein BZG36_02645 [Bifiguratus adelaidae]